MIKSLEVKDFTVFANAQFDFGKHLNVIVGENAVGKTHVLKLVYAVLAARSESRRPGPSMRTFETHLSEKLIGVFRPEQVGNLVRHGRTHAEVQIAAIESPHGANFEFAAKDTDSVKLVELMQGWQAKSAVYFPTRELLTIYPNFVSVYEGHYLEFEETWRDTCILLGAPLRRGQREASAKDLLAPIEQAMDGAIELDKNGRFYLKSRSGRMEMPLVAEGLRKLGMLARLIATGALRDNSCLFWDEPEANLNPRLIKRLALTIVDLAAAGTQVFIATHSLFLLRELDLILRPRSATVDARFFGLHLSADGVEVAQGKTIDDVGSIAALDEELAQSDRYLAAEG